MTMSGVADGLNGVGVEVLKWKPSEITENMNEHGFRGKNVYKMQQSGD